MQKAAKEQVETDRVNTILDFMCEAKWSPNRARTLAKEWGIPLANVVELAKQAASTLHVIQRMGGTETVKDDLLAKWYSIFEHGQSRTANQTVEDPDNPGEYILKPFPDLKAMGQALQAIARLHGLEVQKSESTVLTIDARLNQLSPVQLAHFAETGQLPEEKEELPEELPEVSETPEVSATPSLLNNSETE